MSCDIEVRFRDDEKKRLTGEDVTLEHGMTSLTIHTAPGEYTVIPLVAISYYDVKELPDEPA